jgi:hypothetical protein
MKYSFETSVHKLAIRRYIPGDCKIRNYRCKNIKSYTLMYQTVEIHYLDECNILHYDVSEECIASNFATER